MNGYFGLPTEPKEEPVMHCPECGASEEDCYEAEYQLLNGRNRCRVLLCDCGHWFDPEAIKEAAAEAAAEMQHDERMERDER